MEDLAKPRPPARRRIWLIVLAITILAMVACWVDRSPILRESAALWIVSDPLEPADAIAVLGGGVDQRPFVAADLYKKGLANKVLVANVKLHPIEILGITPPHMELNRLVLLKLGVPENAIVGFGNGVSSTFDEARALAIWVKDNGAHSIIVPTEFFSTRRQRWILNHELAPVGAHVILDAQKPLEYGTDDWWQHEEGIIEFQNEVIKYLYYRLKY